MPKYAYHLFHPAKRTSCVVFASPHSGNDYPEDFLARSQLDANTIRSSEDAFVDRLYDIAPKYGAPFLRAGAPRAFVDLNRGEDELDPALIQGIKATRLNPRVASGLGVIPRVVANGRAIYHGKLTQEEAHERLRAYWFPYHAALQTQLDQAHALFGQAILIDCHSMPRASLDHFIGREKQRPDIVLGDRFGASAAEDIVAQVEAAFVAAGFNVLRNQPFAGAYSVQRYGRPKIGMHAIQVEIDRSIYMDEDRIIPNEQFESVRHRMQQAVKDIARISRELDLEQAAE